MTVDVTADGRFVVEGRLCAAPKVDCRALGGSKDVWGLGARCPPAQSSPANGERLLPMNRPSVQSSYLQR